MIYSTIVKKNHSTPTSYTIPHIFHQTWATTKLPKLSSEYRETCLDTNPEPDWKHQLWTECTPRPPAKQTT